MTQSLLRRSSVGHWLALLLVLLVGPARAQVSITSGNLTYTQNFNTLNTTGTATFTNNTTLPGWFASTGTTANPPASIVASDGSVNTGAFYSFGTGTSTDRTLGAILANATFGGISSGAIGLRYGILLTNNTGAAITSLNVTYTGEQWRNGGNTSAQPLTVDYTVGTGLTVSSGTYTAVAALNFNSLINTATAAALDGNAATNRTTLTTTITFSTAVPDGQQILLRWTDLNDSGNDHGLGVDDLTIVATTSGPPAAALTASPTSLIGTNGLTYVTGGGPASGNLSVSGTNLTAGGGTITAASSSTNFTVSPTSTAYTGSALAATPFTVNLVSGLAVGSTYATNITFSGGGATVVVPVSGTVTATAPAPNLTINDVTAVEGNSGTSIFTFTVTLSAPAPAGGVTFDIATQNGTATGGSDYVTRSLTGQTIAAGSSTYTFDVTVNGDATAESTENFSVVVSNVTGANVTDGVGLGTITNDDASPGTLIRTIQGSGHISPLAGQAVTNVPGIVTVIRANGFYMQDPTPDANDNTSEGIFVFTSSASGRTVGESVTVNGTVQEFRAGTAVPNQNLSTTQLTSPVVTLVSSGNTLPAPQVISSQAATGVRQIPTNTISNDFPADGDVELSVFDPTEDGLDFFETLEGMRVQINNPVTTSNRNTFGEVFVIADRGAGATGLNSRGTLTINGTNTTDINSAITNSDFNPERIQIDDVIYGTGGTPDVNVGTLLNTIVGVVSYDFQNFEILPSVAPTVSASNVPLAKETTTLLPTTNQLTVASFNVENLGGNEGQAKFDGLAAGIKNSLGSPDIIALEEIQDNDGATNSSDVDATTTLNRLITAITNAGGPTYQFRQINPVDDQDGGQPGGNIRVGLLFNPARVQFVDRAGGGPTVNTTVSNVGGQPQLSASPGRILDTNPGEADSYPGDDFTSTRKPLVGEFTFNGQTIFVIVNHFSSRGGSGALSQRFQPPNQEEQGRREEQGKVVNAFVDQLLAINANANVIVAGDFNEFQFLPALQYLKGNVAGETPVLVNLIESLPAAERYTYTFDGNAQALDYILGSNAMNTKLDAYDAVHLNAGFLDQLSDHDPSVARFNFPSALPVTYLNFGARYQAGQVSVSWATASERDNAYFEVERSADAVSYAAVGRVTGKGLSDSRQQYSFTDEQPLPGTSYYRLRQVDTDGTFAVSRPVSVLNESVVGATLQLYPNPTSGSVTLQTGTAPTSVRVSNMVGQSFTLPVSNNVLNVSGLSAGLYLIEVLTQDGKTLRQRFVKE